MDITVVDDIHDNKRQDSRKHLPTVFISIQTGLILYLEFIQRLTGTTLFDTVIKHERDFRIKSPIHIVHDPDVEKNHVSIIVKCFHKIRGIYNSKTLIHVSFLPNKLEHLEKEFSNKSTFDTEDRLIQIHGDFSPWTISPYRRIAIDRYWPDSESTLEDLVSGFNPKEDKIILDLGHDYNIDYHLEYALNHIQKQLNGCFYKNLLFLVPQSKHEILNEWIDNHDSISDTMYLAYLTYSGVNSTDMVECVKKITFYE